MELLDEILEKYELEILWIGVFLSAFQLIRSYLRQKNNRNYLRIQSQLSVQLPLKAGPNWLMTTMSIIFGLTGLISSLSDFMDNKIEEALYAFGMSVSLLLAYILNANTYLSVKLENGTLSINDKSYKPSDIHKVELWDDLIYLELKNKKEIKHWLRFKEKNYANALEVIQLIEQFCIKNNIPVENGFALNIENNEVFNPSMD